MTTNKDDAGVFEELIKLIKRQNSLILDLSKQINKQDKLLKEMKNQQNNFIFNKD